MAITNNLVVWGSAATDWVSASFPAGVGDNVAGFKPGSLIYAQEVNRAFRNATLMQWGLAQVLASYAGSGSPSFAIGFSDVAPTADALNAFANNLSLAITAYVRNNVKPLEADKADAFKASKWVTLTGAVTGSVSSTGGWTITTAIAESAIGSTQIAQSAVTAAKIAQSAVTADKIKDGDVGSAKLATSAVTSDKIKDGDVTSVKIAASAVTSGKIADGAVTNDKLANKTIAFFNGSFGGSTATLGASCQLYAMFGFNYNSGTGLLKFDRSASAFSVEPEVPGDHISVIPNEFMQSMPYVSGNFPYASMVGHRAFAFCSQLASISLPNVEYTGSEAFANCAALEYIDLPKLANTAPMTNVNAGLFANCGNLSRINVVKLSAFNLGFNFGSSRSACIVYAGSSSITGSLNNSYVTVFNAGSLEAVPSSFFANCHKLSVFSVNSPGTSISVLQQMPYVKRCGKNAFEHCSAITYLAMSQCTLLDEGAFSNCSNLASLSLSTTFVTVPQYCFYNCRGLSNVPNATRIIEIGSNAFESCVGLRNLSLTNCTRIEQFAFRNCTSLNGLNLKSESPRCVLATSTAFANTGITSSTGAIHVGTDDAVTAYKTNSALGWTYFASIIVR